MNRKDVIVLIKAAGYHGDETELTRLLINHRISRKARRIRAFGAAQYDNSDINESA